MGVSAGTFGCRERQPKPLIEHAAVVRCERGVQHATSQADAAQAHSIYYRACADIHAQPECRQAFIKASKAPPDDQMRIVIQGCTKAYCSTVGTGLEICQPGFEATPPAILRAWPPFHAAIIKHDAKGLEPRVNNALLAFFLKAQTLPQTAAETPPATPRPDGGTRPAPTAPPPGPAGATPPAGSAPAPAGAAPGGTGPTATATAPKPGTPPVEPPPTGASKTPK
jgi:hypothetical protein